MTEHDDMADSVQQEYLAEKRADDLLAALRKAIAEADGWCDEARGRQAPNLDAERELAGLPPLKAGYGEETRPLSIAETRAMLDRMPIASLSDAPPPTGSP